MKTRKRNTCCAHSPSSGFLFVLLLHSLAGTDAHICTSMWSYAYQRGLLLRYLKTQNLGRQRASGGLCSLFRRVLRREALTSCCIWQLHKNTCFLCLGADGEQALGNALRQRYLNAWNQPQHNQVMLDRSCDVRDAEQKILVLCFIRIKDSLLGILPVGVIQGIRLLGSSSMQETN